MADEIDKVLTDLESGPSYLYECARAGFRCVQRGRKLIDPMFRSLVRAGKVKYPLWTNPQDQREVDLSFYIAGQTVDPKTNVLKSARVLRVKYVISYGGPWYKNVINNMQKVVMTHAR